MTKLIKWLKWIDDNLVHLTLTAFIFVTTLFPKIPYQAIEYTYIHIRFDDIFPVILTAVFFIQLLRRKVIFNTKLLLPIILFWGAVFVSFIAGAFIQNTIPVENLGLLHSLRRIQYMIIFFVASSTVKTKEQFFKYMSFYFIALFLAEIYGIGQKFLGFPSIQSMNPAYVDGRLLRLNPDDRINSTFGGHFDLAAYITFSMPIVLGFLFALKQKKYFVLFVLALIVLLYTAARSSFGAYLISITLFLLLMRKFRFWILVMILTVGLMAVTGDMTKRILQTFQIKTVFVNQATGATKIDQKINVKDLPAGQYQIPLANKLINQKPVANADEAIKKLALSQAQYEAKQSGKELNTADIEKRADEIAKFMKPQKMLLCDISCATRLEKEWPRAISAFLYNPFIGSGPYSITEATDNDILRWFGETGILGASLFMWIIIEIINYCRKAIKVLGKDNNERYIFYGMIFGIVALLLNAFYIDVFEASKIAYNFWIVAGLYVGVIGSIIAKKEGRTYEKRQNK